MVKAEFTKVPFATVRSIVPKRSMLPVWTKFDVTVEIDDNGGSSIKLFDSYYFSVPAKKALSAIGQLTKYAA